VDAQDTIVEAVAIKNGRFLATGRTDDIKNLASGNTNVVNLDGKTVIPGIIDSHTHPVLQASHLSAIDCRQPDMKGIAEIKEKIKKKAAELGPDKWIRVVNFNDTRLLEKRHITRWELDAVSANNPVYIMADTGHQAIANSQALQIAGITKDTQDPTGGEIERNKNGEPTGLLYEMAEHLVSKIMPEYTVDELKPGYKKALNQLSEWGITSTHDAFAYDLGMRTFHQILNEGIRQVRISFMVGLFIKEGETRYHLFEDMVNLGIESGFGNDWQKIIALKLLGGGRVLGKNACVYEPQNRGPKGLGIMMTAPEILEAKTIEAHEAGLRCSIHCIGDRGIDIALDCIEKAQKKKPVADMRHRLEHITLCTPKQLKRIKELGVIPSSSIGANYRFGDQIAENFGPERSRWIYPQKSLKDMGIIAGGNSDFPVVASDPFEQMYAAVTRKTVNGNLIAPEEAIDIMDAIRVYTYNGAYLSKDEDKLGSIEPGKLADLIVLDRDITTCPHEELLETKVLKTIVDGKTVYQQ